MFLDDRSEWLPGPWGEIISTWRGFGQRHRPPQWQRITIQSFNTLIAFGIPLDSSHALKNTISRFDSVRPTWDVLCYSVRTARIRSLVYRWWMFSRVVADELDAEYGCSGTDEGAAAESTMSVGCGLRWRARGVSALHRSQPPTLLDDVCSPAPCPAPPPLPLAPQPTAFTTRLPVIHIHSPRATCLPPPLSAPPSTSPCFAKPVHFSSLLFQ